MPNTFDHVSYSRYGKPRHQTSCTSPNSRLHPTPQVRRSQTKNFANQHIRPSSWFMPHIDPPIINRGGSQDLDGYSWSLRDVLEGMGGEGAQCRNLNDGERYSRHCKGALKHCQVQSVLICNDFAFSSQVAQHTNARFSSNKQRRASKLFPTKVLQGWACSSFDKKLSELQKMWYMSVAFDDVVKLVFMDIVARVRFSEVFRRSHGTSSFNIKAEICHTRSTECSEP